MLKINYNTERAARQRLIFRKIRKHENMSLISFTSVFDLVFPAFTVTPFRLIWIIIFQMDKYDWAEEEVKVGSLHTHTHTH